jgi:hypothetical protein
MRGTVDGTPRTGVACQRQHWSSHKRQCRALAEHEYISTFECLKHEDLARILDTPDSSELPILLKFSAITWTTRSLYGDVHIITLITRSKLLITEQPVPGDTEGGLTRLLKRALTELPWPELPEGTEQIFDFHLTALSFITAFGEPEVAVEILNRHVEDVERMIVAPNDLAKYYMYRLHWLLAAGVEFKEDEGKRGAYVAEAKGLMGRATRSL